VIVDSVKWTLDILSPPSVQAAKILFLNRLSEDFLHLSLVSPTSNSCHWLSQCCCIILVIMLSLNFDGAISVCTCQWNQYMIHIRILVNPFGIIMNYQWTHVFKAFINIHKLTNPKLLKVFFLIIFVKGLK